MTLYGRIAFVFLLNESSFIMSYCGDGHFRLAIIHYSIVIVTIATVYATVECKLLDLVHVHMNSI